VKSASAAVRGGGSRRFCYEPVIYDLSETHVVLVLSYLYPGALFKASLVVFIVNHHLLFFIVA